MKETELRIGNYFYLKLDGEDDELCLCNNFDFEDDEETWNRKTGVPLTEEWLLKFGFENEIIEEIETKLWCNQINLHQEYWSNKAHDGFSFATATESDHVTFKSGYSIKHVHQLQNLYFALTGKELEIAQ